MQVSTEHVLVMNDILLQMTAPTRNREGDIDTDIVSLVIFRLNLG